MSRGTAVPRVIMETLLGHCCSITAGPQSHVGAFGASNGSELFSPSGRFFSVGADITPRGPGQHPVIKPAVFLHKTCDCSYPVGKNEPINSLEAGQVLLTNGLRDTFGFQNFWIWESAR